MPESKRHLKASLFINGLLSGQADLADGARRYTGWTFVNGLLSGQADLADEIRLSPLVRYKVR